MLCDLRPLVFPARLGSGAEIGHLILKGTAGSQLFCADMFSHAAEEVIRLPDVEKSSPGIADAVFAGKGGRFGPLGLVYKLTFVFLLFVLLKRFSAVPEERAQAGRALPCSSASAARMVLPASISGRTGVKNMGIPPFR